MLYHFAYGLSDECLIGRSLCYQPTLLYLDFYCAYNVIGVTILLWVHHDETKFTKMKYISFLLGSYFIILLTMESVDSSIIILIISISCLIYIIIAIFMFGINVWKCNWILLMNGLTFSIMAFVLFFFSSKLYWAFHSLWHIFISIGITFLIESHYFLDRQFARCERCSYCSCCNMV